MSCSACGDTKIDCPTCGYGMPVESASEDQEITVLRELAAVVRVAQFPRDYRFREIHRLLDKLERG